MAKLTYQEFDDDLKPVFRLTLDVEEQHAFIMKDVLSKVSRTTPCKGRALDPHGKDVGSYLTVISKHIKRKKR